MKMFKCSCVPTKPHRTKYPPVCAICNKEINAKDVQHSKLDEEVTVCSTSCANQWDDYVRDQTSGGCHG